MTGGVGAAGYGGELVEEVGELAGGGALGTTGERGALQSEVSGVERGGGAEGAEQALYDVVCRLPWGAVDHAHHTPGPWLCPLRLGAAVGVEDDDYPPPRPARGLEGVVYEELAPGGEAGGRGGHGAFERPDHVGGGPEQVRGQPTPPAAAWPPRAVPPSP